MKPATRLFALLTALNFFNYIDRYVLFAVQPLVQAELHRSDAAMGRLTTAFFLVYMVAAPLTGRWADGPRRRRLLCGGAVLWSLATLGSALAHSYGSLLAARTLVGVGEATFGILAPAYVADLYPESRRGRMLSVLYLAIPMGAAMGYELGGLLGPRLGWRAPFLVAAAPGLLLAWAIARYTPEPARGAHDSPRLTPAMSTLGGLRRNRAFWTATLGMAMLTFAMGGMSVWMPTYLARERSLTLAQANTWFGLITVIDGLGATLLGGWLADRLLRRHPAANYSLSAVSLLLCLPPAVLAIYGPRAWLLPGIALAEFFLFLNTGPLNAAIVNAVGAPIRATAVAVNLFVIHLLGDAFSPTLIGYIADRGSLANGFIAAFVAMAVGALILFYGMRYAPREAGLTAGPGPS